MNLKKYKNYIFFIPLLILNIISLFNMLNARIISETYNNYFYKQLFWFIIGYIAIFIISKINTNRLFNYSKYLYILSIILLFLVLFVGKDINGARCWLNIFGLSFQPSELCKFSLSLYLAQLSINNKSKNVLLVLKLLIITIIPSILVFLEPDTGAIINYFIILFIVLLFIKLNKWWYISGFLIFIIFILFFLIMYIFYEDILINILGTSLYYRMDRIINFASGNSYQLENALITIGASSFLGVGFNKVLLYIPEAPTDFIFAFSIGNFGILSAILIILSYFIIDLFLIKQIFIVNNKKQQLFIHIYLAILFFHEIYNILMNIGLLPIMGIPLPFLSYGGTNLLFNYIYIGFIINFINKKKLSLK